MDLSQYSLFRLAARRLDYLTQRQTVLAQNVANADTPGYQPHDLEPFERVLAGERQGTGAALAATHPQHFSGAQGRSAGYAEGEMAGLYEVSPSGNAVVLEQQMLAVGETAMQHQLTSELYRQHMSMLRIAVTGRR